MVKAIIYTITAILLCIGIFLFGEWYLNKQFSEFSAAVDALYEKVEDNTATPDDGYAVRTLWNDKKSNLQVVIPHNDISYIDYWLSECCGLLQNGEYELALGKVEVLKEISRNLPDAYRVRIENIF